MGYPDQSVLEPDFDVYAWSDAAEIELFLEGLEDELIGGTSEAE